MTERQRERGSERAREGASERGSEEEISILSKFQLSLCPSISLSLAPSLSRSLAPSLSRSLAPSVLARSPPRCEDARVRFSHHNSSGRKQAAECDQPLAYARGAVHPNTKEEKPDASRRQSRRGHRGRNRSWPRDRVGAGAPRVLGSGQLQQVEK